MTLHNHEFFHTKLFLLLCYTPNHIFHHCLSTQFFLLPVLFCRCQTVLQLTSYPFHPISLRILAMISLTLPSRLHVVVFHRLQYAVEDFQIQFCLSICHDCYLIANYKEWR